MSNAEPYWAEGPLVDGLPGRVGDIVFYGDRKPRWIVEWQPHNGEVFAIVDAEGNVALAGPGWLTRDFRFHSPQAGQQ